MSKELVVKKQNLATISKNEIIVVARNMVEHKPRLAVAVEGKKIRDYSNDNLIPVMRGGEEIMVSEKQYKQESIITYLLMLLGITETKEKEKIEHYAMLDIFIQEDYGNYTYEEIKEAFKMAIKGEFDEFNFKLIYKLDAKLFGEVMKYYTIIRNRRLRIYEEQVKKNILDIEREKNKPTEKQVELQIFNAVIDEFLEYKKNKKIEVGRVYIYDWLDERGLMPKDKTTKDAVCNYAKKRFEARQKLSKNKKERLLYQILDTKGNNTISLINFCKEISLGRYFDKFKNKEQLIKNIKSNDKTKSLLKED